MQSKSINHQVHHSIQASFFLVLDSASSYFMNISFNSLQIDHWYFHGLILGIENRHKDFEDDDMKTRKFAYLYPNLLL